VPYLFVIYQNSINISHFCILFLYGETRQSTQCVQLPQSTSHTSSRKALSQLLTPCLALRAATVSAAGKGDQQLSQPTIPTCMSRRSCSQENCSEDGLIAFPSVILGSDNSSSIFQLGKNSLFHLHTGHLATGSSLLSFRGGKATSSLAEGQRGEHNVTGRSFTLGW